MRDLEPASYSNDLEANIQNGGNEAPNFWQEPNEHKIQSGKIKDRFISKNYARVNCNNITTEWLDGTGYSHLNNPSNIPNKFYFAVRDSYYKYHPTFTWIEGVMNDVSKEKFEEFIQDLNKLNDEDVQIISFKKKHHRRNVVYALISLVFFIGFILLIISPFTTYSLFIFLISFGGIFIFSFIILSLFGCQRQNKFYYTKSSYLVKNDLPQKKLIRSWNDTYFMPHGVFVTYPNNLNYIQFNVNKEWKLVLQEHKFPHELASK